MGALLRRSCLTSCSAQDAAVKSQVLRDTCSAAIRWYETIPFPCDETSDSSLLGQRETLQTSLTYLFEERATKCEEYFSKTSLTYILYEIQFGLLLLRYVFSTRPLDHFRWNPTWKTNESTRKQLGTPGSYVLS